MVSSPVWSREAKFRSVSRWKNRADGLSRPAGARGLDSVTLYRGFYVEIDNSPDMDFIWLGINTGYDSVTHGVESFVGALFRLTISWRAYTEL
jgi:hypothetical protein